MFWKAVNSRVSLPCHPSCVAREASSWDKAGGLGEGSSSSQRKAFVLGPHPSPPPASAEIQARSLWYLTPVSSQVWSAVASEGVLTGGWSMWVS